ncbi:WG repeat-containing protein [Salirhabdus sp. Marseille-P4669]|uniref:WG repeat-containing protein n=1 Tax=Salirhabdus sp. Marseille-P4669 TaxID=2042310 RepID=UPI000C7BB41E|nr:WG repeat-containing protein [Salirhabdus sp. Marseille-P4669]
MKTISIKFFAIIMISLFIALTGCSQEDESQNNDIEKDEMESVNETETNEVTEEIEEESLSLLEQGFTIDDLNPQQNGLVIVTLMDLNEEYYYGVLDGNFQWIVEPTNTILEIKDYNDGMAAVAISDPNQMARDMMDEYVIWGFINEMGEWQIEPQYREVKADFRNSQAIVSTVEGVEDAPENARDIVIDKNGEERFVLQEPYDYYYVENDFEYINYYNKNIVTADGFYNADFEFFNLRGFIEDLGSTFMPYEIIGDHIVYSQYDGTSVYTFTGELVNTIAIGGDSSTIYTTEELANQGLFSLENKIMDVNGKVHLDGENGVYLEDPYLRIYNSDGGSKAFYNMNLEAVAQVNEENFIGSTLFNDRFWVQGENFAKLVTVDGEVLIDEDQHIMTNGFYYDQEMETSATPILEVQVEESAAEVDYLLNTETLQMVKVDDLLN